MKSINLNEMLQEAFSKLIKFSKFLFSLLDLLKEPRLEIFLNELGKRFQHKAALHLKDDLPVSVLGLETSDNIYRRRKTIIKIGLGFNYQISKRVYSSIIVWCRY